MKYTGSSDGAVTAKRAGTEEFSRLLAKRWGFDNLGTLVSRVMRSAPADIQKLPVTDPRCRQWLSVHATGRAGDSEYGKDAALAKAVMEWMVKNYQALGIEEVHDYSGLTKAGTGEWGRGWRCNRKGKPAWKDWTAQDNGGTPKAKWIHWELSPAFADDAKKVRDVWMSLEDKPEPKAK
jgi:hypothetical protein